MPSLLALGASNNNLELGQEVIWVWIHLAEPWAQPQSRERSSEVHIHCPARTVYLVLKGPDATICFLPVQCPLEGAESSLTSPNLERALDLEWKDLYSDQNWPLESSETWSRPWNPLGPRLSVKGGILLLKTLPIPDLLWESTCMTSLFAWFIFPSLWSQLPLRNVHNLLSSAKTRSMPSSGLWNHLWALLSRIWIFCYLFSFICTAPPLDYNLPEGPYLPPLHFVLSTLQGTLLKNSQMKYSQRTLPPSFLPAPASMTLTGGQVWMK